MSLEWSNVGTPAAARSRRGESTRQRMILAAADLFAERGIDAVPPHEILAAAGQRNASAIQYYFGTHAGLVIAVLQPRADIRGPIDRERTQVLDRLLSGGRPLTLEGAVAAWALPLTPVLETKAGRSFVRVAAQVIRTLPLADRVSPAMPSDLRAREIVTSVLPPHPAPVAAERMGAAFTLLVELLANRAREMDHGLTPNLPVEAFEGEVVAMLTGMLAAPSRQPGD